MIVNVCDEAGKLVWSRRIVRGHPSGVTSANYLTDGTQQQIIGALLEALQEARGQLGRPPLQIADVVTDIRSPSTRAAIRALAKTQEPG